MSSQNSETRRGRPAIRDDGRIIDAVTDTFWRHGFGATSIADLSSASGAARNSLYKLYGDKAGLAAAAIARYADRFDARVAETTGRIDDAAAATIATLEASANRLADPDAPPGCLRCRMTMEAHGTDAAIDAALADAHARFEAAMGRLLSGGEEPSPAAAGTARLLTALINGMVVMAEAGADRGALQTVIDAARPAIASATNGGVRGAGT